MVRHAHKHKRNIFSKARVYVLDDDRWAIISRRLRPITAILRAIFSRWHYDRDVGDQWTAKCERRLIQAIKEKKCVNKACGGLLLACYLSACYHVSKLENIIIQFERSSEKYFVITSSDKNICTEILGGFKSVNK